MSNLIIQSIEKEGTRQDLPEIKPGYTVRVHQKIKEGEKERIQVYEGLVIAISHGQGPNKTITVRKVVEGIGVEKIFPLSSPNIAKIEVVRIGKVRRAKLYYMRNVSGKAARLKEIMVSGKKNTVTNEVKSEAQSTVKENAPETSSEPISETQEKTAVQAPDSGDTDTEKSSSESDKPEETNSEAQSESN